MADMHTETVAAPSMVKRMRYTCGFVCVEQLTHFEGKHGVFGS